MWEELADVKTSAYIVAAGLREQWLMKLVGTLWLYEKTVMF